MEAGTAGFHVNADIADAVLRYRMVTGDDTLDRECGVELLVETARLWDSSATPTGAAAGTCPASRGRTSTAPCPTTTSSPT
ncbi:hypothetical protein Aau02nite_01170 [Amorphoplanes auranticolor]|uniref:Glycoside hydrolase family 65 central catalytic domain-containing protein n=1 Tax=Actinoplanes auranticolor TaxID=47988 RepID=A0A919S342_9ACTN|nr:hypothetical protein Aau02nite_01170 [Actinoplanes auranticolor]